MNLYIWKKYKLINIFSLLLLCVWSFSFLFEIFLYMKCFSCKLSVFFFHFPPLTPPPPTLTRLLIVESSSQHKQVNINSLLYCFEKLNQDYDFYCAVNGWARDAFWRRLFPLSRLPDDVVRQRKWILQLKEGGFISFGCREAVCGSSLIPSGQIRLEATRNDSNCS